MIGTVGASGVPVHPVKTDSSSATNRIVKIVLAILTSIQTFCTNIYRSIVHRNAKPKPIVIEFGERAFANFKIAEIKNAPTCTQGEIDKILNGYGSLFDVKKNPRIKEPNNTARVLVKKTYASGLPNYPETRKDIQNYLGLIFDLLRPDFDAPQSKKQAIAERLAEAFVDCQVVQSDTITNIGKELACQGNIIEQIGLYWQGYKMLKLEELICERHPKCQSTTVAPNQQFPHVKSAYLDLLGKDFGLEGIEGAKEDKNKPYVATILQSQSAKELKTLYRNKLNLADFIQQVMSDINNPNQDLSVLNKDLLFQWGKTNQVPSFGYYQPDQKNYTGLQKPTEDQEYCMLPYVSFEEIRFLLTTIGIT